MTEQALERGHEVYLVDAGQRRVRVGVQPAWALAPGSRYANFTRSSSARAQTWDTATSAAGITGSVIAGAAALMVGGIRWTNYHLRRRRDWTVTVSLYESRPVKLPGRRDLVTERVVQPLESSNHLDLPSALQAAKTRAAAFEQAGYLRTPYPVGWDS